MKAIAQGRHRYYSLAGANVAAALEALSVVAGAPRRAFAPTTPPRLRAARTCYDHIAGTLGVALHDRFKALGWLTGASAGGRDYDLSPGGTKALEAIGVNVGSARALRRRFAYACLDWSERRHHLAGALGAAFLSAALEKKWVTQDLDSRVLTTTGRGRRELAARFGVRE